MEDLPRAQEALAMLHDVARAVASLMTTRGLRITRLAEFYPDTATLLGTNSGRGKVVSLRLRRAGHCTEFLEVQGVIETVVHELAHNEVGPHDARFYAVMDDLMCVYMQSPASNAVMSGGGGSRFSGGIVGARQASQGRVVKLARSTQVGGRRLGGSGASGASGASGGADGDETPQTSGGTKSLESVRRRLVLEAAERRAFDSKWCGHGRAEDPVVVQDDDDDVDIHIDDNTQDDGGAGERYDGCRRVAPGSRDETSTRHEKGPRFAARTNNVLPTGDKHFVSVGVLASTRPADVIVIQSDSDDEREITIGPASTGNITTPAARSSRSDSKRRRVHEDHENQNAIAERRMKSRGLLPESLTEHLYKLRAASASSRESRSPVPVTKTAGPYWVCKMCTLVNGLSEEHCMACACERPSTAGRSGDYWACHACYAFNEKHMWMCRACQAIKIQS